MNVRKGQTAEMIILAAVGLVAVALFIGMFLMALNAQGATTAQAVQKAKAYKALEVQLRPVKTKVCVGEEAIFELTVVNPLSNPKAYLQLTLMAPPGVTVYAGQGVKGGSGLVTTTAVLNPGDATTIRIRIIAVEPGNKIVSGSVFYWFEGESKQDARRIDLDFPITVLNCKR